MELEEVGSNPTRLAEELLNQLAYSSGHIRIEHVARALDITEIRAEALTNFEGALVTTSQRPFGQILVNSTSSVQRRRFTIAHELGHFLNLFHRPTDGENFMCSSKDMGASRTKLGSSQTRHQIQEREANRFAIELLTPRRRVENLSCDQPRIIDIKAIAAEFKVSKQATAYRYVELHSAPVAIVFSQDGCIKNFKRSKLMPSMYPPEQLALPREHQDVAQGSIEGPTQVEPEDWFTKPSGCDVWIETLGQANGHAMSLVIIDTDRAVLEDEDAQDIEDTVQRFGRFNGSR